MHQPFRAMVVSTVSPSVVVCLNVFVASVPAHWIKILGSICNSTIESVQILSLCASRPARIPAIVYLLKCQNEMDEMVTGCCVACLRSNWSNLQFDTA